MIMGLSGSGKSTLVRCVNRLIEPDSGQITIDGEDITAATERQLREIRRSRISMVFQHFALLPNKTVIENAEFGLKLRGVPPVERRRKAEEILEIVGLAKWAHHLPHALSGGMRQRVGLARALATDADVLLMDEAFSALDPLIRSEMQDELLRLQTTLRKTILFITHDFQEALKLGTRIAIMSGGAIVREGTPQEIVQTPGSDYVASFTREVDRSRLFDAGMVMQDAEPIVVGIDRIDMPATSPAGGRFVVDREGVLLGFCQPSDFEKLKTAKAGKLDLPSDYAVVDRSDKLTKIAKVCRSNRPVAVVDRSGRLAGKIDADHLIAQISS